MGLGNMNKPATLCIEVDDIDTEGFNCKTVRSLAQLRVFVEGRHGSQRWANLAAFSGATELFRFRRIPNLEVTTKHFIVYKNQRYDILSVEDIRGRSMYIEVLAKRTEAANG